MEILSNFHHILALESHWNVTASCQDIKPALSQLMYAKQTNKTKHPFLKVLWCQPFSWASPLLDSPGGEPGKPDHGQFSPPAPGPSGSPQHHLVSQPGPTPRQLWGGPDPSQGTKARSSRNSSAWLMWEQKAHCGKPSWVSAAMRLALHPQAGGLREAPAKPVTWGTWQGGS